MLRWDLPQVRVDISCEAVRAPLAANAEEDQRPGSPLSQREDDGHGVPYDKVVFGKS